MMDPRVNGVPADNVGGVPRPAGDACGCAMLNQAGRNVL